MGADAAPPTWQSHECTSWGTSGGGALVITADCDTGVFSSRDETPPPVFKARFGSAVQPAPIMASYRRGMATEEKRASRGDSSSWVVGLLIGIAIGVAFSVAFSQSKKSQGTQKRPDDDH